MMIVPGSLLDPTGRCMLMADGQQTVRPLGWWRRTEGRKRHHHGTDVIARSCRRYFAGVCHHRSADAEGYGNVTLEHDVMRLKRHRALAFCLSVLLSEKPVLKSTSLVENPDAIFTHRFDEVEELKAIFDEAVGKIEDVRKYTPTQLKNKINENIRDNIKAGKSKEVQVVRDTLDRMAYEFREGQGWRVARDPEAP
jgi:hypothetical protein